MNTLPPEKYWLKPELFQFKKFDYDDINCIYSSPTTLIKDFEKIEGFKIHASTIVKKRKKDLIKLKDSKKKSKLLQSAKDILKYLNILDS